MNLTLNKETAIRAVRLISARPWRHYCYSTRCGCILLIKMRHKKRCSQAAASYRTHDLTPQNYILFFIPTSFYSNFYKFLNKQVQPSYSCVPLHFQAVAPQLSPFNNPNFGRTLAVVLHPKVESIFGCKYIKIFLT